LRQAHPLLFGLRPQDRHAHLQIGRLDVHDQPALKARAQPFLQRRHRARAAVAGENDLAAHAVQRVEGVEELFLGAVLPGDELDVVHQQHVRRAVAITETRRALVADGIDQVVGELLGGHVDHVQPVLQAGMTDGVQQVRFAQPHVAVDKQRVVRAAGVIGHRARGGVGQLIAAAHHEGGKNITRIQTTAI
jgi:hypothetical protein